MSRATRLGSKLGPILIQLPPNLDCDLERLDETLKAFPRSQRVGIEPQHESWFNDETRALLASYNSALVLADRRAGGGCCADPDSASVLRLALARSR